MSGAGELLKKRFMNESGTIENKTILVTAVRLPTGAVEAGPDGGLIYFSLH
jgi:hypothetical protein